MIDPNFIFGKLFEKRGLMPKSEKGDLIGGVELMKRSLFKGQSILASTIIMGYEIKYSNRMFDHRTDKLL